MSDTTTLPEFKGKPKEVHLSHYTPSPFLADHVKLRIDLNEIDTGKVDDKGKPIKHVLATITNTTSFQRNDNPDANWEEDLVLDGGTKHDEAGNIIPYNKLQGLWLNGEPYYDYTIDYESGKLIIHNLPENGPIEITTQTLTNASTNTEYSGLYEKDGIVSTQCESEGFRNMTYALDRPDVISTYEVTIEGDTQRFPTILANPGNAFPSEEDLGNGRHRITWKDDRPKPCYLFAMAALDGDMVKDSFTYPDGDVVDLRYYVDKGKGDQAKFAMDSLKKALQHEYEYWGHKYHGIKDGKGLFMTLAVSAFNMGAMENNGLNIFNDRLVLANPHNATDGRYFDIDSVVNHEYCHDETGNWRVPANWFQIAYKEGLTVFRDQTYTAHLYDPTYQRISDVQELRSLVFAKDDGPTTHPMILPSYEGVSNNYDALTYPKGAQVNRMVQALVGEDAYRRAYRTFHDNPHPEVCDIPTYFKFIGDHSGHGKGYLDTFVDRWTTQSGVPKLKVDWTYDETRKVLKLDIEQILPSGATKPFVLPFKVGLVNPETGKDYFLVSPNGFRYESDVLMVKDMKQSFEFSIVPEQGKESVKPLVSLNRDFTAYAKIEYADRVKPSRADLALQASIDNNFLNRWDALQQIGIEVLRDQLAGRNADMDALIGAFKAVLAHPDISPLLKAELLRLPSESTLVNLLPKGSINPVAIRETRDAVRTAIGHALKDEFKATYDALQSDAPFAFNASEMGRRALMNLSLGYLSADKSPESTALAKAQFDKQHNYNDVSAAWSVLMDSGDLAAAKHAIDSILRTHADDNMVMNDWLQRQAMAEGATPETVKAIMALPQFDIENPNKARSVLGGFIANVKSFHAVDGSGYQFMADQIVTLDTKNKETSARMANAAFGSILNFTPDIQDRMIEAVKSIQESRGNSLSSDAREVLSKISAAYEEAKAARPTMVYEGTIGGGNKGMAVA